MNFDRVKTVLWSNTIVDSTEDETLPPENSGDVLGVAIVLCLTVVSILGMLAYLWWCMK